MKKFEYKILNVPKIGWFGSKVDYQELLNNLNSAGREGWEVVSMANTSMYSNMYNNASRAVIIVLKRELLH